MGKGDNTGAPVGEVGAGGSARGQEGKEGGDRKRETGRERKAK